MAPPVPVFGTEMCQLLPLTYGRGGTGALLSVFVWPCPDSAAVAARYTGEDLWKKWLIRKHHKQGGIARDLRGISTYFTNNCLAFMCYALFKEANGTTDDVKYVYSLT